MADSEEITPELFDAECKRYLESPQTFDIDEDRLLDLIEYALDGSTEFAQAWLLIGAALSRFPDNHLIWMHIAYLLYDAELYDYAMIVLKKYNQHDYWARSLMLLIEAIQHPEKAEKNLRALIREIDSFREDTLSNIIRVTRELNRPDLLFDIIPDIAPRTQHAAMLWREAANWAREEADTDMMRRCIEGYIDCCPLDASAWELSAHYYIYMDPNPDEAINSAEYALAINPKSIPAHIARYEATKMKFNDPDSEVSKADKEKLLQLIVDGVNNTDSATSYLFLDYFASFVVMNNLLEDQHIQHLTYDFNKRFPDVRTIADIMIRMNEMKGEWEIQRFVIKEYVKNDQPFIDDEYSYVEWARLLRADKLIHASLEVLDLFYTSTGMSYADAAEKDAYLEWLYLSERFDEILAIPTPEMVDPMFVRLMYHKLLVAARRAAYDDIKPLASLIIANIASCDAWFSIPNQLADMTVVKFCIQLIEWSEKKPRRQSALLSIDPYGILRGILNEK